MSLTAGKAIKAVLNNKDVHELLSEDGDLFGPYEDAYNFIIQYHQDYQALPTIQIIEDGLKEPGLFDDVGDAGGSTKHYISELREEYVKAHIQDMLIKISKNLDKRPAAEILDRMTERASALTTKTTRVVDIDVMDVDIAKEAFAKSREEEAKGTYGIKTMIPEWDEYSPGGMLPGQNIVLFGFSGRGKSWIADYLAYAAYWQGKTVLFISLEMSEDQQRSRIWAIGGEGQLSMDDLQRGQLTDEQIEDFAGTRMNTGGKIIVVSPTGSTAFTPNMIRSKVEKHKPDLVIVDYAQLMDDNLRTKEMTPRMLNVSTDMKQLAMSQHIPVVTISAVTDAEGKKRDAPPMLSQVAWSKGIEYSSDVAIAVHKYDNSNIVELACRKHRNGEEFNVQYEVDLGRGVFRHRVEDDFDEE